VAEEAAVIAGNVGVAGIHRLLSRLDLILCTHVLVVGMEGALASVVGGLVEQPLIAEPTRVV
jgi:NCAIR mutase (PurE)-related protein